MTPRIRILLIVFSLLFFVFLIRTIRKSKMTKEMATVWIVWALGIVIIAIFPQIAINGAYLLGIQTVSNAIFIIMIFILFCICFYLFIKVSLLETKVDNLVQRIGIEDAKVSAKKNTKRE